MVQLDLKVPTLVTHVLINEKPHFELRPLFVPNPRVSHRRYQNAINIYKKEIRQSFKFFELSRTNISYLLWFLFQPEIELIRQQIDFKLGRHMMKGQILCFRFQVNHLMIVALPGLNNTMYIEGAVADFPVFNEARFLKVVKRFFKKEKEKFGDLFDPDYYFSQKRDFLTTIPLRVEVQEAKISYLQDAGEQFFASLFDAPEFHGVVEIQKVANDLNEYYPAQLNRAFFRDKIVDKLFKALYQSQNTPIAIVGKEGVGRHTIVHESVYRYLEKNAQSDQQLISIWHLDPTRVIAGMSIVGHWQQRFEAIIKYLKAPFPNKALSHKALIDNPIALLRIGKSAQNDMTLSDVLKPYLEKRELQIILIATPEEWTVFQEQDRSFSNLFQVIRLAEPDEETAIQMVLEQRKILEKEHDVRISISAINQLLYLQRNYFKSKVLPGSVIRLLQQLAVKYKEDVVEADQVRSSFQAISGLQERIFDTAYTYEPGEIRKELARELIGQPDAVEVLADVVHLFKSKLNNKSKPISSLFFIGPTGVGKTQAAKVLARYLLGSDDYLMRFDMNEYIDSSAPQRLIGDYYNPEGQLTGKVRYKPFGIVLFDEMEKAHPLVLDLLLQVLDDGRLTDSLGRMVDFTNTIIIMTSNLGAEKVDRTIGIAQDQSNINHIYRKAVENAFRPEFVNRIDKLVVFQSLGPEHIRGIAELQVNDLLSRDGFVRRTTILNISNAALSWVAQRGFDKKMGGRAMRRQIEKDLTSLSAEQLLKINTQKPIVLDIDLDGDHLIPVIRPLDYLDKMETALFTELDQIQKGGTFYRWLLDNVEDLIERINEWEELHKTTASKGWIYLQFKTKMDLVKEQIRTIMIAHEDPNYIAPNSLRIKKVNPRNQRSPNGSTFVRTALKDKLFQEAALKEINDVYRYTKPEFDNKYSEFVGHYIDVALLNLYGQGVMQQGTQQVRMIFQSLINNLGNKEIEFLMDCYKKLFDHLELPYFINEVERTIIIEGFHIYELLAGEEGIHLFYLAQRNPLPINVVLQKGQEQAEQKYDVIRLYDENKTLTDLRTAYTNAYNISAEEFKLLIYGGIQPSLRQNLLVESFYT